MPSSHLPRIFSVLMPFILAVMSSHVFASQPLSGHDDTTAGMVAPVVSDVADSTATTQKAVAATAGTSAQALPENSNDLQGTLHKTPIKDLPFRKDGDNLPAMGMTAYISMVVLLLAAVLVLWGVRKHLRVKGVLPPEGSGSLQYLGKCRLHTGSFVYLVAVDDVKYMIADNGHSIALLPCAKAAADREQIQ